MTNEEFKDFINENTTKSFQEYYLINNQKQTLNSMRTYVIGQYEIIKEKNMNK